MLSSLPQGTRVGTANTFQPLWVGVPSPGCLYTPQSQSRTGVVMLCFAWLQTRENVRQTNTTAIQMQINKPPTPCPGCTRGSSSWQAESVLLGGPAPTQSPDPTPKAMTLSWRSHPLGRSHRSGFPSSPLPGASLCLHPRIQTPEMEEQASQQDEKVAIQSPAFSSPDYF